MGTLQEALVLITDKKTNNVPDEQCVTMAMISVSSEADNTNASVSCCEIHARGVAMTTSSC